MLGLKNANSQIYAILCGFLLLLNVRDIFGATSADSWLMFAREAKKVLIKCYTNHTELDESWRCMKYNSLLLFDDITAAQTIPITNSIEFIRRANETLETNYQRPAQTYNENEVPQFSWIDEMKKRALRTISTHNLRFVIQRSDANEARGRRRRNKMFPAMVFGMAVLGVIIIPVGFHIMSVIGGISLLFGKMALLLATITGFKRFAPPGVPFGHQIEPYGYWDRQEPHNNFNHFAPK